MIKLSRDYSRMRELITNTDSFKFTCKEMGVFVVEFDWDLN